MDKILNNFGKEIILDKSFDLSVIENNMNGNQLKRRYDLDLEFKYPIRPLRSPLDKIN
jgi:hypothetical protein